MPVRNKVKLKEFKEGFASIDNKGFHIKFPNGWTVSVQFGLGNYCENYNFMSEDEAIDVWTKKLDLVSKDAEVWCFNEEENWPEEPLSNQSVIDVLKIMNKISKRK